jgi:hypothetical protein
MSFTINFGTKEAPLNITMPRRYVPAQTQTMTYDELDRLTLLASVSEARQYARTAGANAKARAERFAKKGEAKDAPWTEAEYIDDFNNNYRWEVSSIDSGPRQSAIDKLRHETAWDYWTGMLAEHNAQVAAGQPGVIVKSLGKKAGLPFVHPGRLERNASESAKADHAAKVEAYNTAKASYIERLLAHGSYGPQIAALVDAKLAAQRAAKAAETTAPAAEDEVAVDLMDD